MPLYIEKKINGDVNQPTDQQGEYRAICLFESQKKDSIGHHQAEGAEGADVTDVAAIYMYCYVVRTPWEQALWLYGASEQKVGVDWSGLSGADTPQTVVTTTAPAVLTNDGLQINVSTVLVITSSILK